MYFILRCIPHNFILTLMNIGSVFVVDNINTNFIKDELKNLTQEAHNKEIFGLDIPFVKITLGGQNDGELLHGHGYTYSSAQPGLKVKKMIEAGSSRCIIYFDELDKISDKYDELGKEINDVSPLDKKWEAFNWHVQVIDGHDVIAISEAIDQAKATKGKPSMIILDTIKGKGAKFCENKVTSHNMPVTPEMVKEAIEGLK